MKTFEIDTDFDVFSNSVYARLVKITEDELGNRNPEPSLITEAKLLLTIMEGLREKADFISIRVRNYDGKR